MTCTQASGGGQHKYVLASSPQLPNDKILQKELEEKTKKTGCTDWWLPLLSYNLGLSLEDYLNNLDVSLEAIYIMHRFL